MAAFWKRKTEKSESMTVQTQTILDFLNIGTVDKSKLSEVTYFACLKILGETLGKLPLKLMQQTEKGGVVKAYKHPLYSIAGVRPNPYMTAAHFWSTVEYNRNHYGNAYVWIVGAGSRERLWILPSGDVSVWVDNAGAWGNENAIWYVYTHSQSGKQYKIPSDSILHFRTSTSFDGITGKSVREILAAIEAKTKEMRGFLDTSDTVKAKECDTMTLSEEITRIQAIKPDIYGDEILTGWISKLWS